MRLKTLEYALEFYDAMFERSKMVSPKEVPELKLRGNEKYRLFNGKLKNIADAIGNTRSQAYVYTGLLYRLQAITRLSHSSPFEDGWWMLNFKPTMEQLEKHVNSNKKLTRYIAPSRMDIILSEIAELRARVKELEMWKDDSSRNNVRRGKTLS